MPADGQPAKKSSRGLIAVIAIVALVVLAVPCIGIAAAVAIPMFVRYTRESKVSEARTELGNLRRSVLDYCAREQVQGGRLTGGRLPPPAGPVPAVPGMAKQAFQADDGFRELGFGPSDPVYYSYRIERPSESVAVLSARGDLDGDGVQSLFQIRCERAGDACRCSEMTSENDIE